jgi:CRISPR type III-A-associated RAMP protein Csm4
MHQALLVRLRPLGPWRYGPSDGALDRVDTLYRSDRLFSAVTLAMRQLGLLEVWLDATARGEKPAVAFSSLFPFQGDTLYVTPPAHLWPPPPSLVTSPSPVFLTKVRWRAAHFVPLSLVDSLLTGQSVLADQWIPDSESGCLLRRDRPSSSPFRTVTRAFAAVDRLRLTASEAESSACVEFEAGSGLWTVVRFADGAAKEAWNEPLRSAFRLLADTGFGGGRSKGWGQVQMPEFETGTWPSILLPKVGRSAKNDVHEEQTSRSYWLMSLYSPAAGDRVNWSGGQYELAVRNGRVEGAGGELKKSVRMVVEGCILDAEAEPVGAAVDVAPAGFAHPVYRSGIALSLLVPPPKPQSEDRRAIEEIVPPELEATPFPMPPPVVEDVIVEEAAALEAPIEEPEQIPEEPPVQEPTPDPEPIEEPGVEPEPVGDPEPESEPAIEVAEGGDEI